MWGWYGFALGPVAGESGHDLVPEAECFDGDNALPLFILICVTEPFEMNHLFPLYLALTWTAFYFSTSAGC